MQTYEQKESTVEREKRERYRKKESRQLNCHSIIKTTCNYCDILFFFKMYVMFIQIPQYGNT